MQFIVTKILYIFEYGNNKVANLCLYNKWNMLLSR